MKSEAVNWQGNWICSHIVGGPETSAPAPYLRREFNLSGAVKTARLHITALGLYVCRINGQAVGRDVLAPGWTDYRERVAFQTHDVTELLREGANAIGVVLGDGWYCGHIGGGPRQTDGDRPELLAQLEVELADGSTQLVVSDGEWLSRAGPVLENDLLMGESFDARLELVGWDEPGHDTGSWLPVLNRPNKEIAVFRSPAPPIREQEILEGKEIHADKWARIYDMGQNFSGVVRIKVAAVEGRNLTIRHAEMLNPDGSLYTTNLRSARATDHYTCKGGGAESWQPLFTFHGFRYVQVKGLSGKDTCEVSGVVLNSDMEPVGEFECSNPLLNKLWSNIRWGMKSNFLDVPTDCPQRDERMGWTGDAQVFCRTAAAHMDVKGFFDKWLQDVRDAQLPGGAIPKVVPNVGNYTCLEDAGPAWADAAIICPWTMYLCYGDPDVLKYNYTCMKGYLDFCTAHRVKDHIRNHPDVDGWCYGDWLHLETDAHTPHDLIGTALYANNADILAKAAALTGKEDDAATYRRLHGEIVAAFQRRFVTGDGLVLGGTQTAYVLALHFGLVPEDCRERAVSELVRLIERKGGHIATGFVGTPYILDVLEAGGRLDVAYRLLEQEAFPGWLFPVTRGATTIWERWDGWHPERGFQNPGMNSFNHYAYGAVGDWMMRSLAGIDTGEEEPGYERILFRPRPGGSLTEVKAGLKTPRGVARIEWKRNRDTVEVRLFVPEGASGQFLPPPESRLDAVCLEAGEHFIKWEVPRAGQSGLD
ncbi:MAG: family 78 glycoside hydrolase catalytic domain [Oceanipulchritudo sp.]